MKKNNNKGFTFIELVLYIGILSVFMVAVTSLVGTVVSSNRKMTNRKKIQNEAGETYDTISDMIMGATDVKILGSAYVATTSAGVTSYSPVSGIFIVPDDTDTKGSGGELMSAGGIGRRTVYIEKAGGAGLTPKGPCYDIADMKSFGDVTSPSTDDTTYIIPDDSGKLYLKVDYASALQSNGDSVITTCTITYDKTEKKLYVFKTPQSDRITDASEADGTVLCKDVKDFKLQINPDEDSIAITLELEDSTTAASYKINGVVGIRNSYVLKKHTWD